MPFTPTTEFKERVLKTGAQTLFSVSSSAIFNSYVDYRCTPVHCSPFSLLPSPFFVLRSLFPVPRSPFPVPRSPFPVPRPSFFVLCSSFLVPGFSNVPSLAALIQWEFFWGLPLNSKWVWKINFHEVSGHHSRSNLKKIIEKTVYGHFAPWSFRPQSLRSNQK